MYKFFPSSGNHIEKTKELWNSRGGEVRAWEHKENDRLSVPLCSSLPHTPPWCEFIKASTSSRIAVSNKKTQQCLHHAIRTLTCMIPTSASPLLSILPPFLSSSMSSILSFSSRFFFFSSFSLFSFHPSSLLFAPSSLLSLYLLSLCPPP